MTYARKDLAQESAATRAYMICRNFSVNDGMFPGQRLEPGVQGMPVAIGAGRKGQIPSRDYARGIATGTGTGTGARTPKNRDSVIGSSYLTMDEKDGQPLDGGSPSSVASISKCTSFDGNSSDASSSGKRSSFEGYYESSASSGCESPRSTDSAVAFAAQVAKGKERSSAAPLARESQRAVPAMQQVGRRQHVSQYRHQPIPCSCRRGYGIIRHERCSLCLKEAGWLA